MVTLMLPQRQVPVIDSLNFETSCWFGLPVNSFLMRLDMVKGVSQLDTQREKSGDGRCSFEL